MVASGLQAPLSSPPHEESGLEGKASQQDAKK